MRVEIVGAGKLLVEDEGEAAIISTMNVYVKAFKDDTASIYNLFTGKQIASVYGKESVDKLVNCFAYHFEPNEDEKIELFKEEENATEQ